jgi:serine/threonine protein kinase
MGLTPGASRSASAAGAPSTESVPEVLEQWRRGQADLQAVLAVAVQLPPLDLVEVLSADQHDRWQKGERTSAAEYFQRYPVLNGDLEAACELVYCEFCLRSDHGETPSLEEYKERYPQLADSLNRKHAQESRLSALPGLRTAVLQTTDAPRRHELLERPPEIPDYELSRRIGVGGCGEVWMAKNRHDGGLCAVKLVPRRFTTELDGVRLYRKWASDHPALVSIKHVGEVAGFYYYVMPLADDVHGGSLTGLPTGQYVPLTLRHYLESRGRLPLEEAVGIGCSMLTALAHLHEKGVSHCDVKPDNILCVRRSWQLGDIGLARPSAEVQATRGTLRYWPPEGPRDQTADLYALGLTLFELASGAGLERFQEFVGGSLSFPEAAPRRAGRLRAVILRACHKDPKQRFASAPEMQRALARVTARPASRIQRLVLIGLAIILAAGTPWLAVKAFRLSSKEKIFRLSEISKARIRENGKDVEKWLREGRNEDLLRVQQDALEIYRRELGPESREAVEADARVRTLERLVTLDAAEQDKVAQTFRDDVRVHELLAQDKLKNAIELQRQIVEIRKQFFVPDDTILAGTILFLGYLLQDAGEKTEAKSLYLDVEARLKRAGGKDHPLALLFRNNLAMTYIEEKQYALAYDTLTEVLEGRRKAYERGHFYIVWTLLGLAAVMEKQGRVDEANDYYQEARWEGSQPIDQDDQPDQYDEIAETLTKKNRLDDAKFFHDRAEEMRRAHPPK